MKKLFLIVFLIFGCRNIYDSENSEIYDGYWTETFQVFWKGMNDNYAFWDVDPTDWDKVYEEYLPKFVALDEAENADKFKKLQKAKTYFIEMTKDLVDGHFTLILKNDPEEFIKPSFDRYFKQYGADYYDRTTWYYIYSAIMLSEFGLEYSDGLLTAVRRYVSKDFKSHVIPSKNGDLSGFNTAVGKIPIEDSSNILYFYFSGFEWANIWDSKEYDGLPELRNIWDYFVNNLRAPDVKGIIIDLRGNRGGRGRDISAIWGEMLSKEKYLIGYEKQKTGNGRLDFSPLIPSYIFGNPKNSQDVEVPIVLLINNLSASAAEHSALIARSLPNGFLVGGTTAGAMGSLESKSNKIFSSPGIKEAYIACTQDFDLNKKSFEGKGVEPDYPVPFDHNLFQNGYDTRLEKAIEVIFFHFTP